MVKKRLIKYLVPCFMCSLLIGMEKPKEEVKILKHKRLSKVLQMLRTQQELNDQLIEQLKIKTQQAINALKEEDATQ